MEANLKVSKGRWLSTDCLPRLRLPKEYLNDKIINGSPSLLSLGNPKAANVAIFSSYFYLQFQQDHDHNFGLKTVINLRCWEKAVWLFPINIKSPPHWIVATVHVNEYRIDIFDSIPDSSRTEDVAQVCNLSLTYMYIYS